MKSFKQLLSEISYGPNWDPKAFSRDMFKAYLGRKFDPNVDTDIVRPTIHPHVEWLKQNLPKTVSYGFKLPFGEYQTENLPIQDIHHDPESGTVTVSLDSTDYHNKLRGLNLKHSQVFDKNDVEFNMSKQLHQMVDLKGVTEHEGDDYSGAPDTLQIHFDEDSLKKAHQTDIEERARRRRDLNDYEDDRWDYLSGPEDFQV